MMKKIYNTERMEILLMSDEKSKDLVIDYDKIDIMPEDIYFEMKEHNLSFELRDDYKYLEKLK